MMISTTNICCSQLIRCSRRCISTISPLSPLSLGSSPSFRPKKIRHVTTGGGGLSFDPNILSKTQSKIRQIINAYAIRKSRAPRVKELAIELKHTEEEIRAELRILADLHALVLHPRDDCNENSQLLQSKHAGEVWIAHPFAFYPTSFQVEWNIDEDDQDVPIKSTNKQKKRRVYCPCIWCSLGAASALYRTYGKNCVIHSLLNGLPDKPISITIQNGEVHNPQNLLVHFVVPARDAWSNVVHTCSNMLVFENEYQIEDWCNLYGETKGDIRTLQETMEMATGWYSHYLDEPWRKLSPNEVKELFQKTGFDNEFWNV